MTRYKIAIEDITLRFLEEAFTLRSSTGDLFWKVRPAHHFVSADYANRHNSRVAGTLVGCPDGARVRLKAQIGGRSVFCHRIVYALSRKMDLKDVPTIIDHIDGDQSNNRPDNLREATPLQSTHNIGIAKNNTTGAKGVSVGYAGCFVAQIRAHGKRVNLGNFKTLEEARAAYLGAAKLLQGDFLRSGL